MLWPSSVVPFPFRRHHGVYFTNEGKMKERTAVDKLLQELNQIQAVADLRRELSKTVAVLRALKTGEIGLENLTIDGDNWKVEALPCVDPAEVNTLPPAEPAAVEQTEPSAAPS